MDVTRGESEEEAFSSEREVDSPWLSDNFIDEEFDPAISPPRPRRRGRRVIEAAASNPPSPPSPSGPYFTRAKKVWFLGKYAGLEFPGSEEEAIRGLADFLKENGPGVS